MSITDYITEKRYSFPMLACNCICKTTGMQERETGDWVAWADHVDAVESIRLELVAAKRELARVNSHRSSKKPLLGGERIRCKEEDGTYSTGTVTSVDYDEKNPIRPLPRFCVEWDDALGIDSYDLEALHEFELLTDEESWTKP